MRVLQLTKEDVEDIINETSHRFTIVGNSAELEEEAFGELYVKDNYSREFYRIDVYRFGYMYLHCRFSTTLVLIEDEDLLAELPHD